MDNFTRVRKGSIALIMLFLSLAFFATALLPGSRMVLSGFLVGGAASLMNMIHLAWKTDRLGAAAAEQKGRKAGLGYTTRACIALLAAVIADRFGFSMLATASGLFLGQMATLLLGFLSLRKNG
jgi:ATP synthase protein I